MKTGELRNGLSRYLRKIRETGETITVYDRNTPIAEIRPHPASDSAKRTGVWDIRAHLDAVEGHLEEDLPLPERYTALRKSENPLD